MRLGTCPLKSDLLDLFTETIPGAKREEILDHVLRCPECRNVVSAIWEIQSEEDEILRPIEDLEFSPEMIKRLQGRARGEVHRIRQRRRPEKRRALRWIGIPATGAAMVLLMVFVITNNGRLRHQEVERHAPSAKISLLQPKGRLSPKAPVFSWSRSDDVESCTLAIYDRNLNLVIQTGPGASEKLVLSETALASMKKGNVYFWKIVATLKGGQTIESEFAKFTLRN
jgi:hypothetical protein